MKISAALGKHFVLPNLTRWNSAYDAMTRVNEFLCKQKHAMTTVFISLDVRPINAVEETFLREFLTVMKPLAIALDILQSDECVSAGFLLPTLTNVKEEWSFALNCGLTYCTSLVRHLQAGMHSRFQVEFASPYIKVAGALHPQFRLNWVADTEKLAIESTVQIALAGFDKFQASTSMETAPSESESTETMTHSFFLEI